MKARKHPDRSELLAPISPEAEGALVRLVEALAEKAALRDHLAALATREAGKARTA